LALGSSWVLDRPQIASEAAGDVAWIAEQLRVHGYAVIEDFLSLTEVEGLRSDLVGLPDRVRGQRLPHGSSITWEDAPDGEPPRANQVFNVHRLSRPVDELVRGERLAAAVEPVLGPDPTLFHTKFIEKAARVGSEIPWHQDLSYWLESVRSPAMLTCMILLADASAENGCLEVVPGSHRAGLQPARSRGSDRFRWASAQNPDPATARRIEVRAGTAILFGPLMLHRSGVNASNRSRPSISIALSDGSSWNGSLGSIGRRRGRTSRTRDLSPIRVGRVHGPGPHHGGWDDFYRRRALRILAKDFVRDPSRPWVEVSDSFYEEDSFSWMSSQKFPQTPLTRYQEYDHVRSNRDDVVVHTGDVLRNLAASRHDRIGLAVLNLGTESALRAALAALGRDLVEESILFVDSFFAPRPHRGSRIALIEELARREEIHLEVLARADRAVVLRVAGEECARVTIADTSWMSRSVGIGFGRQGAIDFVAEQIRLSRPVLRFKNRFRPLWRGLKQTIGG
jgi:ectoine hydroxylase-related dioxygenase (phytanoyl-CoA dioxygenase family)